MRLRPSDSQKINQVLDKIDAEYKAHGFSVRFERLRVKAYKMIGALHCRLSKIEHSVSQEIR